MATERLCQVINTQLNPHVFLVGIRVDANETRHAACIEPEQDHWAQSSQLYDVLQDVDAILGTYPESQLVHSHPVAQANQSRWLFHRAVRDAVKSRLERIADKPQDRDIFVTDGVERDGFLVMTVIEIDKEALAQIPAVDDDTIAINEYRSHRVPRSMLEAAIDVLGSEIASAILEPEAGAGLGYFGSTDDLLRKAGLRLFAGLIRRVDEDAIYAGAAEMLFDSIVGLSLLPYETEDAHGRLVFAQQNRVIGVNVLQLRKPVLFESAKAVRKLLMMSGGTIALRCNVDAVLSLVDRCAEPVGQGVRALDVEMIGRGQWRASMDGRQLMIVKDGHPRLPALTVDQAKIQCDLRRLIPEMAEETAGRLAEIAKSLADSGHGAILAIASDASAEATRLANDSLPVVPLPLSPDMAVNLSRIDGAILCDDRGCLHAIGVILDGRAVESGDRGRGSRYNSSLRYALSGDRRAMLVISEDGGLDLLPTLRPALSSSLLLAKIKELEAIASLGGAMRRREKESAVIQWLEKHSFYLDQAQCNQVNDLIRVCDERWKDQPGVVLWIERNKLCPDDAFQAWRDLLP